MAVAARTWTAPYGRYVRLRITAQEVEVDVPNNRSKVRVTGQIYYEGGTSTRNDYPQTYTVTVGGAQIGRQTGITYNLAAGATKSLTTYTSGWIAHNSNGTQSVTVRGHITDGAGDTATINQTYVLTTIARASTLNSFSMPNSLKPDTTTTFNLGITRMSSSFTHDIQLRDGNTVIASWTGQGTPTTRSLTATQTNTLLNRMSSSTTRTMTLRVQTKSGSTNIGGALVRTATVRVSSTVVPTVSGLSVSIEGNAHAKNNVKRFVQSISRVSGRFDRSAKGGASIRSSTLAIRRKSGSSDNQIINSNSGTFARPVANSGQYQAIGTAVDSRGRSSNTGWVDLSNFDVLAYSAPQITEFYTYRQTETPTTVNIVRKGTHSSLSGSNVLTITLQKRTYGTVSWTNVVPNATTTSNTFNTTVPSIGHSIAASFDFRLYIVDQFGNSAEQITTESTQRVVLDIHKNSGVGIGKIRERGVLDVDGSAYFHGDVEFLGGLIPTMPPVSASLPFTDYPAGISMFSSNTDQANGFPDGFHTAVNFNPGPYRNGQLVFGRGGRSLYFRGHRTDEGWSALQSVAAVESGSNENGQWVRFSDGTQFCWHSRSVPYFDPNYMEATWIFPKAFIDSNTSGSVNGDTYYGNYNQRTGNNTIWHTATYAHIRIWSPSGNPHPAGAASRVSLTAMGRWK